MKMNPVLCISREATYASRNTQPLDAYPFDFSQVDGKHLHLINRHIVDSKDPVYFDIGQKLPQVLPYAIIQCGDEYLTYSRAKGTEDRLHGSLSLGFGGHIEMEDVRHSKVALTPALLRELDEEVGLNLDVPFDLINLKTALVDSTNDVGKVHFGLVYSLIIDEKTDIKPDPREIHLPVWQTKEQLTETVNRYENWSQLIINKII